MKINCKKCGRYREIKKVKITHNKIEVCEECWDSIKNELLAIK